MGAAVESVSCEVGHRFSKGVRTEIRLVAGLGVAGDAHAGTAVQHRSRVARDPIQPNLRQVHLIHRELLDELGETGFRIGAGDLGENILTRGLDLLGLPEGARLHIGPCALVVVTGLRNPCVQLDRFRPGLMKAVLGRGGDGRLIRKAGIMGIVVESGVVKVGDAIRVAWPEGEHNPLAPV